MKNKKDKTFLDHYLVGNPLDSYLQPWEYGRLNIVERTLLAQRIGGEERERTERHVLSLHELIPPDPEQDAFFFRKALRGRGGEAEGSVAEMVVAATGGGAALAANGISDKPGKSRGFAMKGQMAMPAAPAVVAAEAELGAVAMDAFSAPMPENSRALS